MAQRSWTQSLAKLFKRKVVALSPEPHLEFSRQCLEEVRKMTSPRDSKSSEVMNYEQCIYLVDSLDKAVHKASLLLEPIRHLGGSSVSTEGVSEITVAQLKILCMLAKKVKCFIQSCSNVHWLLMNLSNFTASLVFDLKLFTFLLPPCSASPSALSLYEVFALRNAEGELVKEMASNDEYRLVTKLRALNQYGQASNDDLELAILLLERLDRFKQSLPAITPGSLDLSLHEKDLSNLKDMVKIATGGFSIVYKARWLGIDVAVKTFYGTDNPDFTKEVPILARLSHPNIVSFLCHGKDRRECFIVMELMENDLSSLMKDRLRNDSTRSSPFSVFEEFDVMLQIAEAMDHLHEMRVLHRDLKSSNILVRCMKSTNAAGYEYVQVKVSDFGLSRTKEFSMTRSHMTPNMGTARWMAPELIKFQNTNVIRDIETAKNEELVEKYPFKCDVYSFGMVCLEILTGDVPFPNMTANEVKRAVCAGRRPQLPDRCPKQLKALIEKCWNPEASSRPCFGDICTGLRHLKSLHMTRKSQGTWIRTFTIADLRSVTGNFVQSCNLGRGDCSVGYNRFLADGSKVAVKRMKDAVTRLSLEFIELQVGGWMNARHRHFVEMLGYCIDGNDLLLVTEYMSQGTLAQLLFQHQEVNVANSLWWTQRLGIAVDVAQALDYMHESGSIFSHFSLKSSNVLLDDDFNAKVWGFGLTNRFAEGSLPQGTGPSGYMAPKYSWGGWRTKADHVYSLGVVLVELLTGHPAVNKEQDLVKLFREERFKKERFLKEIMESEAVVNAAFDSPIHAHVSEIFNLDESTTEGSMHVVARLAMSCTADNPEDRPNINHAVSVLQRQLLLRFEGNRITQLYLGRSSPNFRPVQ